MARVDASCGAAGRENLFGYGIAGHDVVGFEELDREKRNLFDALDLRHIGLQKIAEITVHGIVRILVPKHLERQFVELLAARDLEYVLLGNHVQK